MLQSLDSKTTRCGMMHNLFDRERDIYFDKYGSPISRPEFERLHGDSDYVRVAYTRLTDVGADPSISVNVSTVWLGFDYSFGTHTLPVIFETAIFSSDSVDVRKRYYTVDDAQQGHLAVVNSVAATMTDPVIMNLGEDA